MKHSRFSAIVLAAAMTSAAWLAVSQAQAADYPSRNIRMIVPFPAGGSADTLTRVVAQEMSETLGQAIVVENRTGAGGNLGADVAAKAAPDGYTLFSGSSSLPIASSLFKKLSYDPMKDFASISMIGRSPMIMTVNPAFSAKSVAELIAMAKQKPGEIAYASAGYGSVNHLAVEMFKSQAGIDLRHVPYRGNPLAAIDVISGQVPVFVDYVLTGLPHVRDGKLRALATTSATRLAAMPDLPTISESGVPGFEASLWFAFFAPAGTPPEIVAQLDAATQKALAKPAVRERLATLGMEDAPKGREELDRAMARDHGLWKAAIDKAGISMD